MKTEATWNETQAVEKLSTDNLSAYLRGLLAKAKIALRGLLHMAHGRLSIRMPDGRMVLIEGRSEGPDATLILHNWNLAHRALTGGTIGVAESYIDGDWESPDVTAFLELFLVNVEVGDNLASGARGIARVVELIRHWLRSNSRSQARKNISAHYDLGNTFYSKWLDETMTYSSALYSDGANDLASAQTAKYRALAEAAGLKAGDHVLEIGCGWGGFAEFAASEIGCRVTGLTISREQLAFARERIEKAGLSDKVDLRFQDYRDETGKYDGIVSIEMFEAVGEKYWPTYFSKVRQCLKPGGKADLQIITIKPDAYEAYRANPDFIQRYVFPGGMLPTENHLKSLGEAAELEMVGHRAFGPDYGRTLAEWRQRFWNAWDEIQPMGFDLRFRRLWEFYMYYCEAGFRSGHINVRQVVYS
ncbi:cyclopropane-fatty-acyl-phospholipid synthase family protein [Hoeflea alexandrii]|uniref:SAM-dependent methyltransferase n=1 Tax=Hoeflea alexandrii TaxID=288436 RepID=UPI0022721E82|nr:cyclopropane-fatty-acyl-phospholipid synthase family protein [Hoeflea alexandrii]MCY0153601.1 cyclopropane-fatty-acyl-phospholipid synthase family protein [Hoeflea alexandrii]